MEAVKYRPYETGLASQDIPWTPLYAIQPPTLQGLVAWVRFAGAEWSVEDLGRGLCDNIVWHGKNRQFFMPDPPSEDDWKYLEDEKKSRYVKKKTPAPVAIGEGNFDPFG